MLGPSTLSLPLLQSSVGFHFSSEFQLTTLDEPPAGQADKTLQERARIMTVAHSRNPKRFAHGAPVVKPFPKEVWINKPLAPDCQKPTMKSTIESKLIPLGNEKQGLVRQGVSREAPDGSILANPDGKPCQSFNKKGGLHGSLYFSKNWFKRS